MVGDGKKLESLVRFIEEIYRPKGFEVVSRDRVFDEGIQIAEFDVQIRGKIRTSDFKWLIECRDRPKDGRQSGAWIEQLAGRRKRFGFDKVTAVSGTGFTEGAAQAARNLGIELREVATLQKDATADWLRMDFVTQSERIYKAGDVKLLIDPSESDARQAAMLRAMGTGGARILRATPSEALVTPAEALMYALDSEKEELFADLEPNGPSKNARFQVSYPNDDDHFVVDTDEGPVRVKAIDFSAVLSVRERLLPLIEVQEYRVSDTGEIISQVASYAEMEANGINFVFELHRLPEGTHLTIRKTGPE